MAVASDLGDLENDQRFNNAQQLRPRGRPRPPDRRAGQQPEPRLRQATRRSRRRCATRSSRSRTGASSPTAASTSAASAARSSHDVFGGGGTQGGSTITQQFVKNAENQQQQPHGLREAPRGRAGLPPDAQVVEGEDPHRVPQHDLLRQRRLRHRVGGPRSTSATSTRGCGTGGQPACASQLRPEEAALLAGMVANPSGFDPQRRWAAALAPAQRRAAEDARAELPRRSRTTTRRCRPDRAAGDPAAPGAGRGAGPDRPEPGPQRRLLQHLGPPAARRPLRRRSAPSAAAGRCAPRSTSTCRPPPSARSRPTCPTTAPATARRRRWSSSTTTRARSGRWSAAPSYAARPFNLATQGQRQPGSAFKPFVLAAAIRAGHLARAQTFDSRKKIFTVPGTKGKEKFVVNNYEGNYTGVSTLAARHDLLRQLGLRRGRLQDRLPATSPSMATRDGHPHARSRPTRRSRSAACKQGVTVARHGPRLRDLRRAAASRIERHARRRATAARSASGGSRTATARSSPRTRPTYATVFAQPLADAVTPILQSVVCRRHRHQGPVRRLRGRQDRHDRELRRRLVRRLHRAATRSPSGSAIPTASSR